MKTAVFKISEMIAGLEEKLKSMKQPGTASGGLSAEDEVIGKVEAKLEVLRDYKDLTVVVRKYSARQKRIIEKTFLNLKTTKKGVESNPDMAAGNRLAVQFGVINMEPRRLDMVKIQDATSEDPEIWQITDAALDDDKKYDWDLEAVLLEMLAEVNPKNWNW